jgi:hypothetical protein
MARESADITMSNEELLEFLGGQRTVALASLEPDGSLWCSVEPFVLDGGEICVDVEPGSRTGTNLAADPRVCGVVESASTNNYEIRSAIVHGDARLGPDGRRRLALDDVITFDFSKIDARF